MLELNRDLLIRLLLGSMLLLVTASVSAIWPSSSGGNKDVTVIDSVVGQNGDVFVVGHFGGNAVFGAGTSLAARGIQDVFVARYSQVGVLVWVEAAGSARADTAAGIAVDESGNIYITGTFAGQADFGATTLQSNTLRDDVFVAKLNANGSWIWARRAGGPRTDQVAGIGIIPGSTTTIPQTPATAVIGGAYRCGFEIQVPNAAGTGTVTERLGSATCNADAYPDQHYLAAIDSDGNWRWAFNDGVQTGIGSRITGVDVSADGRLLLVGSHDAAIQIGGKSLPAPLDSGLWQAGGNWDFTADIANSGLISAFVPNTTGDKVNELELTLDFDLSTISQPWLRFFHRHELDASYGCFDVAQLEYSIDGGQSWGTVEKQYLLGHVYNGIGNGFEGNPLSGDGWCYRNPGWGGWDETRVDLSFLELDDQVRFRWNLGEGTDEALQGWWLDDVSLLDGEQVVFFDGFEPPSRTFVGRIGNPANNPNWAWVRTAPNGLDVESVVVGPGGDMFLAGTTRAGGAILPDSGATSELARAGAAIARLDGADGTWKWGRSADGGRGVDLVVTSGGVFLAGHFTGTATFIPGNPDGVIQSAGQRDLFVARAGLGNGLFEWVSGGNRYNVTTGVPGQAGGSGDAELTSISTDRLGNLYVGGNFSDELVFGKESALTASGARSSFMANLSDLGIWFEVQTWLVGQQVAPPPNADVSGLGSAPDILVDGQPVMDAIGRLFFWARPAGESTARLTALDAIDGVEIRWRVQGEPPGSSNRISALGRTAWPTQACTAGNDQGCYQVHVAGAPVEIEEPGSAFRFVSVFPPLAQSSGGEANAGVFNAFNQGFSVLLYTQGASADPFQFPISVEVVRSFRADLSPNFVRNVRWDIGEPIVDAFHNQPGRTGYVLNPLAFFDGAGSDPALDRAARTGSIIAVNKIRPNRIQDAGKEMLVAWYRRNAKSVYWPQRAIEYAPDWPLDPERIIIASQTGAEVLGQQPLSPTQFPDLRIYQQPQVLEPGYKPNAAHAFFAPSNTGSGILALFALRADFGINLPGDLTAAADPYVLIKYWSNALNRWAYRVFYVTATGAGFEGFQFSGTAGTAVTPPYPLSILPGCDQSIAEGQQINDPQPPPPFFKDYKNGLWSKSAGDGAMLFHYPMQPGFVYDVNNDDMDDASLGQCVPWMARLPVEQGGTASPNTPIRVEYSFSWPTQAPQLIPGETLLRQKRGLPNIFDQDAVEVVFDEYRETLLAGPGAEPKDSLVQLMDPLNPRFVRLPALQGLATQLDPETGWQIITGSGDGLTSLPVSIRQRLRYDPINQRLIFSGVFDDSLAGEPFLLLNVMSFREASLLKQLDGSGPDAAEESTNACQSASTDPCNWAEAIEALFRLTRNPNGVERICVEDEVDPDSGIRSCTVDRDVDRGELLVAFQDPEGEGFLQPYQGVGVQAALSAGATEGTGWVTLAFNNDPGLDPAPVSVSIIRVECLAFPEPPATPDFISSYQGQLNVIMPDNIFDEQITLRHSGDFGGKPDNLLFEWYFQPDLTGLPPSPLPDPDSGQLNGWQRVPLDNPTGAIEIVIEGANIQTLSDNWYLARYRNLPVCNNVNNWSLWAGGPGGTPVDQRAQLALGWIKRVVDRLNPFEARVLDFHSGPSNTFASMLIQLGERYEGDVPLSSNPSVINELGLIEAYTTVMRRALDLSVNAVPPVDYGPANNAILNIATRIADFYALLGNEAYADAQDPTIGLLTSGEFASFAPSIFPFQNQLASTLEQELVLLRGRDTSQATTSAPPVYNRLFWNFTTGDGEVAYALNYGITDQNNDGVIDEFDARIQYPQGHGDAWGHYLTGIKTHYELLRNPFFTWEPRAEAVPVAGVPLQVDFFDERKFARLAAAKARTGAEIVNLTYRQFYVEDPRAQWQGYKDDNTQRAWGLSEWARRAGQGAYLDWVVGNAILPDEDPDPGNLGIQQIDRTTVSELDEIVSSFDAIQAQLDGADRGLNPLGLARDVVPFDIDPSRVDGPAGQTHFEQVFERAQTALDNAVKAWDFANQINRMLRFNQDTIEKQAANARSSELNFNNRLIEIFGYPYPDDIGPGGVYPTGYNGPDVYHYMYVDVMELVGQQAGLLEGFDLEGDVRINRFTASYKPLAGVNFFDFDTEAKFWETDCGTAPLGSGCALGPRPELERLEVPYVTYDSPSFGFSFGKPPEWTSRRRATGSMQNILHDLFSARLALIRARQEYDNLAADINDMVGTISATFAIGEEKLRIANDDRRTLNGMNIAIQTLNQTAKATKAAGDLAGGLMEASSECVPKNTIAGVAAGGDLFSVARCGIKTVGKSINSVTNVIGEGLELAANGVAAAQDDVSRVSALRVQTIDARLDLFNLKGELDEMLRREPLLRLEMYSRIETIEQLTRRYLEELSKGQRLMAELVQFRKTGAAATQEYRYLDMGFRIFRNDALQKYRATFDLAARYAYLAAATYDYETNLLGTDQKAGQRFLTDIVRERSIGQVLGGQPVPSSRGLADPLGRMQQNFAVLKGQMGFNNPQVETNRFSLRRELFRLRDDEEGDEQWRQILEEARVDNLWALPEFRRYARPPQPESAGPLPGLVFRFPTTVTFGLNFFHWPLGPGDSTYDPTRFATKVRSVGTWFRDYAGLPLTETPRVYMFPVGADVLRAAGANDFSVREWQVIDQVLPVPFPIGSSDLQNANWLPLSDSLSDAFNEVRRYSQFRAHHFTEPFDDSQVTTDSRLIGRSVWNREWVLIIPGGSLLADANEGLETFIQGTRIPGTDDRDGEGVSDIRIFFKTYSYSGN